MHGPCWHCHHYAGLTADGLYAVCANPGCCRIRTNPAGGCSAWEREPGVDDEPWAPDAFRGTAMGMVALSTPRRPPTAP